ncbi:TetR/AcrR family transcriptional regulator C-terminal domain-containing protein [Arthrobacter sp. EpRS71]|uniref:TetR/AcrR family transcriptional regulator n=1 Tax=Arthrobacter sp. EpRS71 TaxID=1743141 RepID=UPI000747D30F|nr:TetR/AcrR family transcriptional regulator C-terminal domain-containing protein [Arthrobacter sp. EpRS71]KUM35796.1 AcrR family transcriptional regulator [Arthrobacter sp. EpRS71]
MTAATPQRLPLSRERVLECAVALADESGIAALTIRTLAHSMGTKPMSLYYYVANKDDILDGIVDIVFSEIDPPMPDGDWREEMQRRATGVRAALKRHPWAVGLVESRSAPGPATLRHHEATLATLRAAGFSVQLTAHAYALLDSYIYGFAVQEAALPFEGRDTAAEITKPILERFSTGEYPRMVEIAVEHVLKPGYDFGDEFIFGLDLILDGLQRLKTGTE